MMMVSGARSLRSACRLAAFLGLLSLCSACRAEGRCPWLNAATASGALNGPARMEVHKIGETGTACVFQYKRGAAVYRLAITVIGVQASTTEAAPASLQCASPAEAVRAIGNEAVMCTDDKGTAHGEQVIGRVRDRMFVVSVSTSLGDDPSMPRDVLRETAKNMAEQVAGSMF